jgi:RNA polymerase sigma-70 factor, ECF subfamily
MDYDDQFPENEVLEKSEADGVPPLYTPLSASEVNLLSVYFAKNYTKSYKLALAIIHDKHMAQDIAHESFYKACGHFRRFTSYQHFVRWQAVTIKTTAVDAIRKSSRYVYLEDYQPMASNLPADTYLPETMVLQEEEKKTMWDQVESLAPIYSDIICLKFFHDLSYHEIAKLKGIKENTLRSQVHRALKLLWPKVRNMEIEE